MNLSMASPSGDTSIADFSMASISQGGANSSDHGEDSSCSNDSTTQVVKIEKKKQKRGSALQSSYKAPTLYKLDEVEEQEDGYQIWKLFSKYQVNFSLT